MSDNRVSPSLPLAVLLTTLVAYGPISTDLYLPSLPTLGQVFSADTATVQLTLSAFLIAFAVSQLIYGPLSDRFGRRPVLIGGCAIYVVASLGCVFAQSIETLIVARFFQALGACSGPVVARAVVRDVYSREGAASVLSYIAMAMSLAPAIGPIIGGVLTEAFGWRANFILLTGFGMLTLVSVMIVLQETNTRRDPTATRASRIVANAGTLLSHRAYVGYALVVTGMYASLFSFISGSSFVLIDTVGLSPRLYGFCFATFVAGYVVGAFLSGRFGKRVGLDRMIRMGTGIGVVGGTLGLALAAYYPPTVVTVVGPSVLFMVGAGLTLANGQAGAIGPFPGMAGMASAVLGFLQMGGGALVGIAVGHAHDGSALSMAIAIFLATLVAAVAHRVLIQEDTGHEPKGQQVSENDH